MGRRKIFREKIRQPDEFISTSARAIGYVKENPQQVVAAVGAVVLAFVAVMGISRYLVYRADSLAEREWRARSLYEEAVEDSGRVPEAIASLKGVYEKNPGTMAGQTSLYLAGSLSFRSGDFAGAVEDFRALTGKHDDNEVIYPLALGNLAYALEGTGDHQGAAEAMERLLALEEGATAYQAKLDLGRIYEELGDGEKARALWEEVLDADPESDWAAAARRLLGLPPPADAGV